MATYQLLNRVLLTTVLATALHGSECLAKEREEFHQTYALSAEGELQIDNVNGQVRITAWDRAEVQVDAVKKASSRTDLEAVKIEIDSQPEHIRIHTQYPEKKWKWWGKSNSTAVEYEIKVPWHARLRQVRNVNGTVEIEGVQGKVEAATVNGRLHASGLASDAHLQTVNGAVEARFQCFANVKSAELKTVNGKVALTLPAMADAEVSAHTVNGGIHAPPELGVKSHRPGSKDLHGQLGKGGAQVRLNTVNGAIQIDTAALSVAEQPQK